MQHWHPGHIIPNLAHKAQTAVGQVKGRLHSPAAAHASRSRAQAFLNNLQRSPLAHTPVGQALIKYTQSQMARGEGLEEFEEDLKQRAKQQLGSYRQALQPLSELLQAIRAGGCAPRLRTEVIWPAQKKQVNTPEAWQRVSSILATPFPFLTWVESKVGPLTIALGMKVQGGLGVGVGAYEGIAGLRYHCACHYLGFSVGAGAIADAAVGVQLSVSPGKPDSLRWRDGITVEVDMGGGYNATGEVAVSFIPTPRHPTLKDNRLFDYTFAGIAVSLGTGGGLDLSVSVGATKSTILVGQAP